MDSDYKLRVATEKDIKDIMKIETSSFSLEICENEDTFLERINTFSDGFYLMEYNNSVIGYIGTEIWEYKEETDNKYFTLGHSIKETHNPNGNELYISSMGILPDFRGKGLGKVLFQDSINYIINKNKNIKSEILIVSEKWDNARKIYKKNGFCEILNVKDFFVYNNDYKENGIVMRKYL